MYVPTCLQFVIISLRNNMFELADRLVGIYKTDNTTKTIAINPGEYVVQEAPAAQDATQGAQQQAPAAPAAGTKASQQQQRRQGKENLGKQVLSSEHEQEEQQAMAVS
jgi:structural maintenance of chromosome 4